jgi:multiple sugar transport system ATP-binding protein
VRLPIPQRFGARLAAWEGKQVILGIRPEDIFDPAFPRADSEPWLLDTAVDIVEAMGNETHLHLSAGEHMLVARVDPRTAASAGETFTAALDISRLHFFDTASEEAIVL